MENSKNTLALELRSTFLLSRTSSKVLLHSLVQFFPPPLYLKWVHCHDVMDVTCITKLCLGWTKADYIVLTATDRCSKKIENWYVRANGTFIGFTLKRGYTVCAKCLWLFTRWHQHLATFFTTLGRTRGVIFDFRWSSSISCECLSKTVEICVPENTISKALAKYFLHESLLNNNYFWHT